MAIAHATPKPVYFLPRARRRPRPAAARRARAALVYRAGSATAFGTLQALLVVLFSLLMVLGLAGPLG